jgi:putative peptide zinc metalloprotease protein
MAISPQSQSWYRVAKLRPQLAARADASQQDFRGVTWFVLRDPVTGKFSRLSDSAYNVVSMMDGTRSVAQIWDLACAEFGDEAPTQDDLLAIIAQLHSLDLLITDGLPDAVGIAERGEKSRRKQLLSRFMNPLALRFPLFDPDTLISELWPLARPLFTRFGAVLYLVLIIAGAVTAMRNWEPLTSNLIDRILSAQSLAILALVYPFVKLLHELGHGFAVKKYGGEVREVGVMFLVFIPVPYVDASAATGFTSKWKRMFVGSAGILVELALAAAAMLIWTQLEEGFWRAASFNVMIIGGVSTLLFNGNPLLRFDGYYVLSDYLEIPNLGNRSNRYLGYLIQRYVFGMESARSPVRARGEAPWFFFYSIAAFIYRIFISFAIISIGAVRFFIFGVLFAVWSVTLMFLLPIFRHLKFLATDPRLRGMRGRAWLASVGLVGMVVVALAFVPVPYRTVTEGVLQGPDHATVYSTETGQVDEILERANTYVEKDAPILILGDPFLPSELEAAEADGRQYELRYRRALSENAFDVRFWREQLIRSLSEQEQLRERILNLTLTSPRAGTLIIPDESDLQNRFVQRGDVIAYIVDPNEMSVRTAVSQDVADLIRRRTQSVSLRPAENLDIILEGEIVREVPTVGKQLPSLALSVEGGGQFALDPSSETGPAALQQIMQFDIGPIGAPPSVAIGTRVYVRFDFGSEPVAARVWRSLRQIFLARFDA